MDDYDAFVYLDVQKTGSTFISEFLSSYSIFPRTNFVKHGRIGDNFKDSAFYFISVREPLRQYLSLYQYGVEGKGSFFNRLRGSVHEKFYDGSLRNFEKWLEFVLDPANAELLGEGYSSVGPELYGYQTFRFLVLSFRHPITVLREVQAKDQLDKIYDEQKIHRFVVRTETLRSDMAKLSEGELKDYIIDVEAAKKFLLEVDNINASKRIDCVDIDRLSPEILSLTRERESFLYDRFYRQKRLSPGHGPA